MRRKLWLIAVVSVLFLGPNTYAQNLGPLGESIIDTLREHQPNWKLSFQSYSPAQEDSARDFIYLEWKIGEEEISSTIFVEETTKEASDIFSRMSHEPRVLGMKMKKTKDKAVTIGDEYYIWEDLNGSGRRGIIYRKQKTIVYINGYSIDAAKRLATLIETEISTSK